MSMRNDKKKLTHEDKFARNFNCDNSRLRQIRSDKRQCTHKMRQINRKICNSILN